MVRKDIVYLLSDNVPVKVTPRWWLSKAGPAYDTGRTLQVQAGCPLTLCGSLAKSDRSKFIEVHLLTLPVSRLDETAAAEAIRGPILSLDLGAKRVGAAVSDPSLIAITRLATLRRSNWKQLLRDVDDLIRHLDAKTLVIGFPLKLDGSEGSAATEIRQLAQKFARSLELPIFLQDERLTSREAEERLRASGYRSPELESLIDGEAAAIILSDFINSSQQTLCPWD